MKPTLLIVDDDEEIRTQLKWGLESEFDVLLEGSRSGAVRSFNANRPAATLLDLGLPPHPNDSTEGLETLHDILEIDDAAKIIAISGQEEREHAARAVGAGACDFLCKPLEIEAVRRVVERCVFVGDLAREYREIQGRRRMDIFEGMVARSSVMQDLFEVMGKVARSPVPVLILGEGGTGKEMAARAIHRQSGRPPESFIAIDCEEVPADFLEQGFFAGEENEKRRGDVEREESAGVGACGTLFLDNVEALTSSLQARLLSFLQKQRARFFGGGEEEGGADLRVIAASSADLAQAAERGAFPKDLYSRLAVVVLNLPPLRERGEDIVLLAEDLLGGISERNDRPGLVFTPKALRSISRYSWPGNVRELQDRIERAVIAAEGICVSREDLELSEFAIAAPTRTLKEARELIERKVVQKALAKHEGNVTLAAAEVGVSRPTFYDLMRKLKICRD